MIKVIDFGSQNGLEQNHLKLFNKEKLFVFSTKFDFIEFGT